MRKLLLTTAALAFVGAAPAMATGGKSVDFNISSSLAKECTIGATDTDLTVGPAASATDTGDFQTTCNFELSDLTLTFTSSHGGVKNDVENVTELYNVTFDGETFGSDAAASGYALVRASGAFANYPIDRSFTVALQEDLSIAGEYADVLTIDVAP